jgi:hypothetical protein
MMSTAPPFLLTREQATRLHGYIQTYRQYALTRLLPSTERNVLLRGLQALQGKLIEALDRPANPLRLVLSRDEVGVLNTMVNGLLTLYGGQAESAERTATINDLAALKLSLKGF